MVTPSVVLLLCGTATPQQRICNIGKTMNVITKQVQQILEDQEPVLPIAYYGVAVAMKSKVNNFVFNPTAYDYMLTNEMNIKE